MPQRRFMFFVIQTVFFLVLAFNNAQAFEGKDWDGVWVGKWGGSADTSVTVKAGRVTIYSYQGASQETGKTRISKDSLTFGIGRDCNIEIVPDDINKVLATYTCGETKAFATLLRANSVDVSGNHQVAKKPIEPEPLNELPTARRFAIPVPLDSEGLAIQLTALPKVGKVKKATQIEPLATDVVKKATDIDGKLYFVLDIPDASNLEKLCFFIDKKVKWYAEYGDGSINKSGCGTVEGTTLSNGTYFWSDFIKKMPNVKKTKTKKK